MYVIIHRTLSTYIARSQILINQTYCREFFKVLYNSALNFVVETKRAITFQRRRLMTSRIGREGVIEGVRLTLDFEGYKGYSYYWVVPGVNTSFICN